MSEKKVTTSPGIAALLGGILFFLGFGTCIVLTDSPDKAANTQAKSTPNQLAQLNETDVFDLELLTKEVEVEQLTKEIDKNHVGDSPVSASILNRLMQLPIYASYSAKTNVRAVINKTKADGVITTPEFKEISAVLIDEYKRSFVPTNNSKNLEETVAKL